MSMDEKLRQRCFDALLIVSDVGATLGGSVGDAIHYIEQARETNRQSPHFSQELDNSLDLALMHLRELKQKARKVVGDD